MDMSNIQDIVDGNPLKLSKAEVQTLFDMIVEYGARKCLEGNRAGRFATAQERVAKERAEAKLAEIAHVLRHQKRAR
jgi:hypothetical protein